MVKAPKGRVIRMVIIPEPPPGTRSVLKYTGAGTVVAQGPGNTTMACGKCGAPLIKGAAVQTLRNIVLICKNCGSYNESLVT